MSAIRDLVNQHARRTLILTNEEQRRLTQRAFEQAIGAGHAPRSSSIVFRVFEAHFSKVVDEFYQYTLDAIETASDGDDLSHILRDVEVDVTIFRDRIAHSVTTALNDPKMNDAVHKEFDDLRQQKHIKFSSLLELKIRATLRKKNMSHNINFNAATSGVQIGDNNQQTNTIDLRQLLQQIDISKAPDAEKAEAKSRIVKLLEHPLVSTIASAAVASLISAATGNR